MAKHEQETFAWMNDELMKLHFANWKSTDNKPIVFNPKESLCSCDYVSPVRVAFQNFDLAAKHMGLNPQDIRQKYEYVGDRVQTLGRVFHVFRDVVTRKTLNVEAPMGFKSQRLPSTFKRKPIKPLDSQAKED